MRAPRTLPWWLKATRVGPWRTPPPPSRRARPQGLNAAVSHARMRRDAGAHAAPLLPPSIAAVAAGLVPKVLQCRCTVEAGLAVVAVPCTGDSSTARLAVTDRVAVVDGIRVR